MTERPPAPETSNVPAATSAADMSPAAIEQAMIAAGLITPATGGADFNRVRIDGQTFIFGDPKNPEMKFDSPSDGSAAFRCQIVQDAIEYNARYFDETLAQKANRPTIANKMCKTHVDEPTQAGERAEDGTPCRTCPVYYRLPKGSEVPTDGNGIAKKCSGMLDVEFRLLDNEGKLVDDRVWTLSLSTTGLIEWQGSFTDKAAGYVSQVNFKRKLAILAAQRSPENIPAAIVMAAHSLAKGGVLAEAKIVRSESGGNRFSVPSFNPYDIIAIETAPALDTEEQPAPAAVESGTEEAADIPF